MRILNVNSHMDPESGGGGTERTLQMSRYLSETGHQCTILTTNYKLTQKRVNEFNNVNLIALPCFLDRYFIPLGGFYKILKIVKQMDVVHLMAHWSPLNSLVYLAIRMTKKPYVFCPAGTLSIYGRSKKLKMLYNYFIGNSIVKESDALIAVTDKEKHQILEYDAEKEKIVTIPNGINPEDFTVSDNKLFRKKFNLPDNPLILFIGRLNKIKGPDLLLSAFINRMEELSPYHLVLAGPDSGMKNELLEIVHKKNEKKTSSFYWLCGGAR